MPPQRFPEDTVLEHEMLEKRPSLSDQALERILEAIVKGHLKSGDRVQEAVLARQLGISRGPLREAIRRLEGRRLLVRIPHIGVKVAEISDQQAYDMFMIREALEGVACRLAAVRMTDAQIDELEDLLSMHSQQPDVSSGHGYYQDSGDHDFHFKIITGSQSQRLQEMLLGELYEFLRIFRYRSSVKPGRTAQAHFEHQNVVAAIRKRDPELAEMMMRQHLRNASLSLRMEQTVQAAKKQET